MYKQIGKVVSSTDKELMALEYVKSLCEEEKH